MIKMLADMADSHFVEPRLKPEIDAARAMRDAFVAMVRGFGYMRVAKATN